MEEDQFHDEQSRLTGHTMRRGYTGMTATSTMEVGLVEIYCQGRATRTLLIYSRVMENISTSLATRSERSIAGRLDPICYHSRESLRRYRSQIRVSTQRYSTSNPNTPRGVGLRATQKEPVTETVSPDLTTYTAGLGLVLTGQIKSRCEVNLAFDTYVFIIYVSHTTTKHVC